VDSAVNQIVSKLTNGDPEMAGARDFLNHAQRGRLLPKIRFSRTCSALHLLAASDQKASHQHRHALDFDIKTQELRANGRTGRFRFTEIACIYLVHIPKILGREI